MNEMIAACGAGVVTFLITWGATRVKLTDIERRTELAEEELHRQLELIHSLRDIYVSREHFNEIMMNLRETQRELKDDLKKIIDLLAARV